MKKIIIMTLLSLVMLVTACGKRSSQDIVSKALSLDLANSTEVLNYDTHGGNGDGTTCIVLNFCDDAVLKEIQESKKWSPFPMNKTVQTLVYGTGNEVCQNGSYLTDSNGEALVPTIQNGYYILTDRQRNNDKDILSRYSFNFDLAIYDSDTNTLYFCRLDT